MNLFQRKVNCSWTHKFLNGLDAILRLRLNSKYARDFTLKTSDWIKRDCIQSWRSISSIPALIGSNDDRKAVCKIITGSYHQDKWFGSRASCLCVWPRRCRRFGFVCCVYFPKTNRAEIAHHLPALRKRARSRRQPPVPEITALDTVARHTIYSPRTRVSPFARRCN